MGLRFRIGDWLIEPDLNHIVRADRAVQIEPKVMDVLAFLASHPGEVCSKETIIKAVWPGTFVSDDVLTYSISELRKAFGDNAREPSVIATIAKRGYRLIAPVTCIPEERYQEMPQARRDLEQLQSAEEEATRRSADGRRTAWSRAVAPAVLLSAALLLVLLMWHLLPGKDSEMARIGVAPIASATARSIAVIPFENLSPDPENAFFAEDFTEDLINSLSKIGHLRVISFAAAARYHKDADASVIEKDLGVEMILTGSVRRDGGQIRISTQLVEAKTARHLWGEVYDRELTSVFRIQSDVARTIAATLSVALSATEKEQLRKEPTANLTAYDYYLKGREYYRRYRSHDNENAIELFEKALELDPNLALAHAGLADCYAQKTYQFGFPAEWTEKAMEASRKALSINPNLAEAHKALGFTHAIRGRLQESLKSYYRAVELNPNYSAPITNIAVVLEQQGKFAEALQWAIRSLNLNPVERISNFNVGDIYWDLHDIDRAEEWYKRALSLDPDYEPARLGIIRIQAARKDYPGALEEIQKILSLNATSRGGLNAAGHTYLASGDLEKAEECYRKVLTFGPNRDAAIYLSLILWKKGARDEAQQLSDQLIRPAQEDIDRGNESWQPRWVLAVVRAAQGETTEAISQLEKAAAAGWRPAPGAWDDPHFENLLGDPRFRDLMTALKADVDQQRKRAFLLTAPPK
jgi:TolB-like protein/DNA-binding winged helix-turn-helix (wHTH) protein/lipopolysaccharide biosynthesis regulator YciM